MVSQIRLKSLLGLAFAALLTVAAATAATESPFASAPVKAQTSTARLLAGEGSKDGIYSAGLEIDLDPKTITYWRQPGDAGVPPVFDFSRSDNIASVEVLYPAPKHIEEAGSVVAGYDAKVTFPLRVRAKDPQAPVTLNLSLDYAACGKICLPARARLSLILPRNGVSPYARDIALALAQVPRKATQAEAKGLLGVARREGQPLSWRLNYLGKEKARDLFAEAPDPLFLDSARAPDGKGFDLTLATNGVAETPEAVMATVTIVTDTGAFEAPAQLQ
jgi:DsbC/DsbD-like thiol-disulfide interchange protein